MVHDNQSGTTIVNLAQVVDMALGGPDPGIVNFTLLQYLLHIMLEQMHLNNVNIEFRGAESDKINKLYDPTKESPSIVYTEYSTDEPELKLKKAKPGDPLPPDALKKKMENEEKKEKQIRVIHQRKDSKEDPKINPTPICTPIPSGVSMQTILVVPQPQPGSGATIPGISKNQIEKLAQDVDQLKKDVSHINTISNSGDLIEQIRKTSGVDRPVSEIYQILNVSKRMDATEEAMDKLAGIIEEMVREMDNIDKKADTQKRLTEHIAETKKAIRARPEPVKQKGETDTKTGKQKPKNKPSVDGSQATDQKPSYRQIETSDIKSDELSEYVGEAEPTKDKRGGSIASKGTQQSKKSVDVSGEEEDSTVSRKSTAEDGRSASPPSEGSRKSTEEPKKKSKKKVAKGGSDPTGIVTSGTDTEGSLHNPKAEKLLREASDLRNSLTDTGSLGARQAQIDAMEKRISLLEETTASVDKKLEEISSIKGGSIKSGEGRKIIEVQSEPSDRSDRDPMPLGATPISNVSSLPKDKASIPVAVVAPIPKAEKPKLAKLVIEPQSKLKDVNLAQTSFSDAMSILQDEIKDMRQQMNDNSQKAQDQIDALDNLVNADETDDVSTPIRITKLERKFNECVEQLNAFDAMFTDQVGGVINQVADLERELGALTEKFHYGIGGGTPGGDLADNSVMELYNKVLHFEEELGNTAELAHRLLDDRDKRDGQFQEMQEQLELLKMIKADKQEMEDALADKVDVCMVNRKVSHDQFDATCDSLNKGLEDALAKLTEQEEMWNVTMMDLQKAVSSKVDKGDLAPLQEFVNHKIITLQEKMKTLAKMKKETEAAGTKMKLLKEVQCISCDKDTTMRTSLDPTMQPQAYALPPAKNMGPYLAYELDQLRRQNKKFPARNLNHFEDAMGRPTNKDKDHVCNRYCGGSHTVTTPSQRVTRLGHFLDQWGHEDQPEGEMIKGADGMVYKGSAPSNAKGDGPEKTGEPGQTEMKSNMDNAGSSTLTFNTPAKGKVNQSQGGDSKNPD